MGRRRKDEKERLTCLLAGNPNVGKSTLFNAMTGMHRHTGNWAGKTVDIAVAALETEKRCYSIADIPGTYSLLAHSAEEEVARNYICFGGADACIAVCDATSLEHSLALVLQMSEVSDNIIVCINLIDEAERCGIVIDTERLSELLGAPVAALSARRAGSVKRLTDVLDAFSPNEKRKQGYIVSYPAPIRAAAEELAAVLEKYDTGSTSRFWIAMRLIEGDVTLCKEIYTKFGIETDEVQTAAAEARRRLFSIGFGEDEIKDAVVSGIIASAEAISREVVRERECGKDKRTDRLDAVLTGRVTAFPIMLLLLGLVLWITLSLANYPSELLSRMFSYFEGKLALLFDYIGVSGAVGDAVLLGIYRTTASVVSVMLPPMVIFFPMFTLLEDSGYLPRVAYNLDRPFAASGACGKQALTMCMGLGCNAVGISGARIIDSRRERLLAIMTNSLMPCNGRLPMLISVISIAFLFAMGKAPAALVALSLLGLILLAVAVTLAVTLLLSKTLLAGELSSFTIELPPYRRPEFLRVIFRSLTTRVAAVLLRAVTVAAPMGLIIFLLMRISIGGVNPIFAFCDFLEPLGRLMGLDGAILAAFILGLPANEIVIPILIMLYTAEGSMGGELGISAMSELFSANGWNFVTAACFSIFALFHFPCSTSIITAYKETGSVKHTLVTALLPAAVGFLLCVILNFTLRLFI